MHRLESSLEGTREMQDLDDEDLKDNRNLEDIIVVWKARCKSQLERYCVQ